MPLRCLLALLLLAPPIAARALCTSDGVPPPTVVLERFLSADCGDCWRDPDTPRPDAGALALDWVLPGQRGEDAPLSAAALPEAVERLQALGAPSPLRMSSVRRQRSGDEAPLRVALGQAFNDYIGASIEQPLPGTESWRAWLLLVERLPAGTEGSPVERQLVRKVFRPDWGRGAAPVAAGLVETRAMQLPQGVQPDRLRLVALLEDARGRIRAIRQTECP